MRKIWLLLLLTLSVACSQESDQATSPVPAVAVRHFDPDSIARGAKLFDAHCAQCHGPQAQGHPDWQTPSDGSFAAAPPLNGTGHDWQRSRAELAAVIKSGVRRKTDKVDVMPGWKGRLSDRDIEDVINWMQSLWPPEVYETWNRTQAGIAPKS